MRKMKFFIFGFLLAVWATSLFFEGDFKWVLLVVLSLMGMYLFGLMKRVFVAWFVIGVVCGFGRYYLVDLNFRDLSELEGDFFGCVVKEVDVRRDHVKYTLEVEGVDDVLVLLNGPRYPVYQYGDCFDFRAHLRFPEPIEDFRYDLYLHRYGIGYVVSYPKIFEVYPAEGSGFFAVLYRFKIEVNRRIVQLFGEPTGSLVSGLLLGSRRGMSEELTADLQKTGLSHIVAISGYNITLVILFVGLLLSFLSRKLKILFSLLGVVLFVLLVGAGAAVVRAALMGGIGLLALFYGRQYFVDYALWLTAFVMSLVNPLILTFDSGFHFSFLATMGLIYVVPNLQKWARFVPERFLLRENFLMTISAQLMVLPVSIWNFGGFSWLAPLINLVVLPFIPLVMLLSALALLFSCFSFVGGEFLAFLTDLIVGFLIWVIGFFADLPWGFWFLKGLPWWLGMVYYGLLYLFTRERAPP